MVKIGMIIGSRYEIQELIGTGGMSDVYRAKDNKLNRNVAVKVLKQEFAENRDFVSKFRREAEAAANLMHPNIVTVYDVGEDSGISYIVMELVDGYTLKQYIEKKSRLTITECISIAIPIASGIEAAHNKGIIHRDIKPQNVIISKDGKVKVTDFGIAKTTTSNTISSNVMGSVHYTSPEQARGGFSDEKSDIYSLGITLFEMVTGRVPFNGDTTVAIAIKHIQEDMPSPKTYVEDLPISIEQIILKCTQKSPDRRYQKMSEVIEDLKKAYISPNENFVKLDTYESNSVTKTNLDPIYKRERRDTEGFDEIEKAESPRPRVKSRDDGYSMPPNVKKEKAQENGRRPQNAKPGKPQPKPSSGNKPSAKPQNAKPGKPNPNKSLASGKPSSTSKPRPSSQLRLSNKPKSQSGEKSENKQTEMIKTVIICGAAIVIGILLLALLGKVLGVFSDKGDKDEFVKVPACTNKLESEVKRDLEDLGLEYEISYEVSANVAPNRVISTDPNADTSIKKGSTVKIVVCRSEDSIVVSDVSGMTEAEATAKLESEGFTVEKVFEKNDDFEKGRVVSQTPDAGSSGSDTKTVTIVVCSGSGKEKVKMPDLTGKTEEEARNLVQSVGMTVKEVSETYSNTVENGKVCYQSYTAGSVVKEGAEVTLKLSLGPEPRYYSCNHVVQAPAKYTGGPATIILKTPDGTELLHETSPIFPYNISLTQIYGVPKGIVEITYQVMIQEEVVDGNGNVTIQNVPAQDSVSYEVDFQ
ncbi:MAG: Stk1 family PASTA domain-containing Ser/Thr kinase [Lachnospiraceae bacterium]|nr:Stk1 family PASTA domain-containing Ser/Thr kinase [Lachnospiraceae bacterium]